MPADATGAGRYAHPASGRSRAAIRGVLWSSLHTAVPSITSAIVFFVAARFLAPADFGVIGLATSVVAFATALAPGALGEALIQRREVDDSHTDSVFWLTSAIGLFFFLPFALCAGPIAAFLREPALAALLPLIGLRLPFELAATVPNALIVRSMQFRLVALRTTVATLTGATLCLALLFAGYGYWALAVSQVTVSVVTCVAAYWASGWRPGTVLRLAALRQLFGYGIFASGTRMLSLMSLDQILLGLLAGAPVLGLFYFARRLFTLLSGLIAGSLSSVSHVLLSSLQDEPAKMRTALRVATYASALASFPIFIGLSLVIGDAIPVLFGAKWMPATGAVQAFCVIGVLAGIGIVQGALITSQGKAHWWFQYQLAQQAGTLGVIWAFSDDLPLLMAMLAAKTLALWPLSVWMTVRLLRCPVAAYLRDFALPAGASLAMAAAVLAIRAALPVLGPGQILPLQIAAGAAVYVLIILTLGRNRIADLRRLLRSKGA